jgi:hypothetical protein
MPTYRLTKPIAGFPAGENLIITIPAGAIVERDAFLSAVGLTVIRWNDRRVTVTIQAIQNAASQLGESG